QIEAGITGRPVFSVRVPEYAGTQEGTLHLHYLLNESGGLLHMADTLEEHAAALTRAIEHGPAGARRIRTFVESCVQARGMDTPATPLLADAIEELARMPKPAPERPGAGAYALRAVLYPAGSVLKFVRYFSRLARKRERQLRPLTVSDFFLQRLVA